MSLPDPIREALAHPLTAVTAVLGTLAHLVQFGPLDAVAATVWSQASTLFTFASVGAFTFAPNVPSLPAEPLRILALLVGAIYLAKLGDRVVDALQERVS